MTLALILLAHAVAQASPPAPDACAALIPPALSSRLSADLPGYSPAQAGDAGETRNREIAANGDWPCPFVVAADFDGNGSLDRALLVKSAQGIKLIAAFNNQGQWQLTLTEDWPLTLADTQLKPLESGLYQRSDAIEQPTAQLDQLASIQAENSGFSADKVNGRHTVYFFVNDKWQKLWLKDE